MLFKAVAGLWPLGAGRIELPKDGVIFFMPQKPYLPIGALRGAVRYPADTEPNADEQIRSALQRVGLDHLTARLDESAAWEQILPVGEPQRLGFARLLLRRPGWIFIHEATDALDPRGEEAMMRLVDEEFAASTVLTIGHHPALDAYHRRKLALIETGGRSSTIPRDSYTVLPAGMGGTAHSVRTPCAP